MKSFKEQIIPILVIFLLISAAWAVTKAAPENVVSTNKNKLFVSNVQGMEINKEAIKNSINLYQDLSEDKKIVIRERMAELSRKRQEDIEKVKKQIKEYKLQKKLQKTNSREAQINQLQAIQKIALKENATETVKSLEILISWYKNKQKIKALD